MKIGLLSAILEEYSFEEYIDKVAELGLKSVELACWPNGKASRRYAGVCHIDVDSLDEGRVSYINDYTSSRGVCIAALGYYPNPLDSNKEVSETAINHIKKVIDASNSLGVNKVSTFVGRDKDKTLEENYEIFSKVWPPIIEYAEERGVYVGIENCPMFFTMDEWPGGLNLASSPAIWRRMFEIIDSPYFGLSYDPSHLYFQGMDYIKPLDEFYNKIFHIHIKDIKIHRDRIDEYGIFTPPLNYMDPKIPSEGGIDWKLFMESLIDKGYAGPIVLEIEDKEYESSSERKIEAIKKSYSHIKQFI